MNELIEWINLLRFYSVELARDNIELFIVTWLILLVVVTYQLFRKGTTSPKSMKALEKRVLNKVANLERKKLRKS